MKIYIFFWTFILFCIIKININYALSEEYKNYLETDIYTVKIDASYLRGHSILSGSDIFNLQNGIDFNLYFNLLYNIEYLNHIYLGVNPILANGTYIDDQMIFATIRYNLSLLPVFNFYVNIGAGLGISYPYLHFDSSCSDCNIKLKNKKVKEFFINTEYFGKYIGYPNFGIYTNFKVIYSKYQKNDYVQDINYYNYFIEIGFIYKIQYWVNS